MKADRQYVIELIAADLRGNFGELLNMELATQLAERAVIVFESLGELKDAREREGL